MNKTRFIELLTKRDCGEITLLEQKELADLAKQNEDLARMLAVFEDFNKNGFQFKQAERTSFEHRWDDIEKRLESDGQTPRSENRGIFNTKKLAVAASLLAIVVIGAVLFLNTNERKIAGDEKNMMITKRGSKSYLVLPDGTQVWLNNETKISYAKSFGEETREVTLSGEAYFNVIKNPAKPFVVHTTVMDVTALGTEFNVNAYANNQSTEATLINGSVQVTLKKDPNKKILLKPFEKISVQHQTEIQGDALKEGLSSEVFSLSTIKKQKSGFDTDVAKWAKNSLVFKNNTLEEIAEQLSRWYDVEVAITDDSLKLERYSAEYDNYTLEEVMQSLKLTGGFRYSINNKKIIITP